MLSSSCAVLGLIFLFSVETKNLPVTEIVASTTSHGGQPSEFRAGGPNKIMCRSKPYTEARCELVVYNIMSHRFRDLKILVENPSKSIIPSPSGAIILVVLQQSALTIDLSTLRKEIVILVDAEKALGRYTEFPLFVPDARWLSDQVFEFSIYPSYMPIEAGIALRLKTGLCVLDASGMTKCQDMNLDQSNRAL